MNRKETLFRIFIVPIVKLISPLFFDKKYLKGRHFDNGISGWFWVCRSILWQKIFGFNHQIPWPVSPFIVISNPNNIVFHVDNLDNFQQFGNYFQNLYGKITIGHGTYIAPNVGIITTNHDPKDLDCYLEPKDVVIGENCWIGMNSMLLPGVHLGNSVIVGAGSVVTKSFDADNIIIAGNPAKVIKNM